MYVFHMLVIQSVGATLETALQGTGTLRPLLYSLAVILLSYALGWASYQAYERHFLALKRYFIPL
jgi:peptidoglycan/LPS O-acetylase OafA/YrhL